MEEKISRRKALKYAGVAAAGIVAGAAGVSLYGQSQQQPQPPVATVAIRFEHHEDFPPLVQQIHDLVAKFESEYPSIKVVTSFTPWDTHRETLLTEVAGGEVPDVGTLQYYIPEFAKMGALENLENWIDPEFRSSFHPSAWAEVTYLDKVYAIPFQFDLDCYIYNIPMFKREGIEPPTYENPWTWEQQLEVAKRLTKNGVLGWPLRAKPSTLWKEFRHLLISNKADFVVYRDGKYQSGVNDPASREAFTFYADLVNKYKVSDSSIVTWGADSVIANFKAGKLAMTNIGNFIASSLEGEGLRYLEDWGTFPNPKGPSGKVSGMWASIDSRILLAASRYKKEGFEFIKFLNRPENQITYCKAVGTVPSTVQGMNSSPWSDPSKGENGWIKALNAPNTVAAALVYPVPEWGEIEARIVVPTAQDVIVGKMTADDALDYMHKEINKTLGVS